MPGNGRGLSSIMWVSNRDELWSCIEKVFFVKRQWSQGKAVPEPGRVGRRLRSDEPRRTSIAKFLDVVGVQHGQWLPRSSHCHQGNPSQVSHGQVDKVTDKGGESTTDIASLQPRAGPVGHLQKHCMTPPSLT